MFELAHSNLFSTLMANTDGNKGNTVADKTVPMLGMLRLIGL